MGTGQWGDSWPAGPLPPVSKTRGLGLQRGSECRLNAESLNELIMALSRPAVARRSQRGRGGAGGSDTVAALRLQGALVSRDVRVLSEGPPKLFPEPWPWALRSPSQVSPASQLQREPHNMHPFYVQETQVQIVNDFTWPLVAQPRRSYIQL